jgi:hypothetical protein
MKCILFPDRKIIRTTDADATLKVNSGKATYASKESWKKATRPIKS